MKKYSKKEFTRETVNVIESLTDKELQTVRSGLYILIQKLKTRGMLNLGYLNEIEEYMLIIETNTAVETIARI